MLANTAANPSGRDARTKTQKAAARLTGLLAFLLTFCLLTALAALFSPADYLLTRIAPDLSPYRDFVQPESLRRAFWTSMTSVAYEDGRETGRTVYRRALWGDYTVLAETAGHKTQVLRGVVTGRDIRLDVLVPAGGGAAERFLAPFSGDNLLYFSMYDRDDSGRLEHIQIFDETQERTLLSGANFYYFNEGLLTKQTLTDGEMPTETLASREYFYEGNTLVRTEDTSGGALIGSAEYSREGMVQTARFLDADGVPAGTETTTYGPFGLLLRREVFDAAGDLVRSETYHYRIWEWFVSPSGLLILAAFLIASFAAASAAAKAVKKRQLRTCDH